MVRVALIGAGRDRWQSVAARLRNVTLETDHGTTPALWDGVIFLRPGPTDVPSIEPLLCAGKHVLLTASAGISRDMLQSLNELAQQHRAWLAVVNPERYLPSRQHVRQQLDAGKIGTPGLIRLHRWTPAPADDDRQPQGLAGPLLRDLEVAFWFFGKPPELVYAFEQQSVQIHLGFPGGGMALLDHSYLLPAGDGYYSLSVIGSSGATYTDDHYNTQLVYRGGSPRGLRTGEGIAQWTNLVKDFVDSIQATSRAKAAPATHGWQNVLAVSDAIRHSLRTRQAIAPQGLL